MRISVIIPTLNAEKYLPELISRLQSQTIKPYEIIVVDSTSEDRTATLAKELGVSLMQVERTAFDHGGTRNLAARQASGDIFVYMTQDAIPMNERMLASLVRPFADPQVAAVYGRHVARRDASVLERMTREFNYPPEPVRKTKKDIHRYGIKTFFYTNVCSAVRREVFEELGGFPERVILNEDMMLAARTILQGYAVQYAPDARVIHSHDYMISQQFKRYFDIGVSMRMNDWLLQYAKAEGEGFRFVRTQLRSLRSQGHWDLVLPFLADSAARFAGYRLGLAYRVIPRSLRRRLSMHAGFWR